MRKPGSLLAGLLLLLSGQLSAEVRSLTILHTNDLHAHLSPLNNGRGGFAYLATALRRERAGCNDCIVLNAGDLVQGDPVSTIFQGVPVFEIANLLGFDAATLGNHDFDYGWEQTRKFISIAKYPIVSCNIVDAAGKLFAQPYVVLKVNGLRIGILGAMLTGLRDVATARSLGEWHTLPVVETARKYAAELRPKTDLIVLLGHIDGREELQFLREAPEISVIVSGHLHTGLTEPISHEGRVAVRVRSYSEEFGRLELKVDTEKKAAIAWNWKRIPVDSKVIAPDAEIAAKVKHWEGEVSSRVDRPLAISERVFTTAEVRRLIEHAMRDETGADFAFMNSGGVRESLPKGQLYERNIWEIMPFDNLVVVGTFKGHDLPKVVVGDRKIDPDRDYTLAVSDFTAANQATNENLRSTGLKFPRDAGVMRDLLIDWFRKQKIISHQ